MNPAIRVDQLSKHYKLGERQRGYKTLRETIADAVKAPFRRFTTHHSPLTTPKSADFWALKDVSFEVQPGEVVGIIGRNGAGKSTLLKILSRITEPTRGRIEVRGHVASLLEVGTGFHHELTGRENVYQNGSILGMSHREINRKFDEIVAFSEVEDFLDTPVKRYSSGMQLRLAFAVAAHLEPEILIVDEVLAVGDAAFQTKCLKKLNALGNSGRTILFVTHNLGTVASLCNKAVCINAGEIIETGEPLDVVRRFQSFLSQSMATNLLERTDRRGSGDIRLKSIQLLDGAGSPTERILAGDRLTIELELDVVRPTNHLEVSLWLVDASGARVTLLANRLTGTQFAADCPGAHLSCTIPQVALAPGEYQVDVSISVATLVSDALHGACCLTVDPGPFFATGITPSREQGAFLSNQSWQASA